MAKSRRAPQHSPGEREGGQAGPAGRTSQPGRGLFIRHHWLASLSVLPKWRSPSHTQLPIAAHTHIFNSCFNILLLFWCWLLYTPAPVQSDESERPIDQLICVFAKVKQSKDTETIIACWRIKPPVEKEKTHRINGNSSRRLTNTGAGYVLGKCHWAKWQSTISNFKTVFIRIGCWATFVGCVCHNDVVKMWKGGWAFVKKKLIIIDCWMYRQTDRCWWWWRGVLNLGIKVTRGRRGGVKGMCLHGGGLDSIYLSW